MIRQLNRLTRFARWRYLRWAVAAPLLPLALWACNATDLQTPMPKPEQQNDDYFDLNPNRDVDILFMVDDSPSMTEEQNNVRQNFHVFTEKLQGITGGLPNLHLGVVSSDLGAGDKKLPNGGCPNLGGDRGIFQTKPECGLDMNSRFLSSLQMGTVNNFNKPLDQVFSCMANLGVKGCGYEHQLQAARVALYEDITPDNKGFLRPDAYLAIILITDEDDCSAPTRTDFFINDDPYKGTTASFRCAQAGHMCNGMAPPTTPYNQLLSTCEPNSGGALIKVQEVVDSIRRLKQDPNKILVSGIFGWPTGPEDPKDPPKYAYALNPKENNLLDYSPICHSANGEATAGLRLKQFVESFGDNGTFFSICNDDFSPALEKIGEKLAARLGRTCITAPLVDTDLNNDRIDADCQVTDKIPQSGGGTKSEVLPACTKGKSASGSCWTMEKDTGCTASGYRLDVKRDNPLVANTTQTVRCRTCPKLPDPYNRCAIP
jgi:hypothetical protein